MTDTQQESIEQRLKRIESRLVQLMLHLGMDPYNKTYDGPAVPTLRARPTHVQD